MSVDAKYFSKMSVDAQYVSKMFQTDVMQRTLQKTAPYCSTSLETVNDNALSDLWADTVIIHISLWFKFDAE